LTLVIDFHFTFFGRNGGLRAQPGHQVVSIYFIFAFLESTKVSIFSATIFVKPTKIQTIINEIQVTNKKMSGFLLKPTLVILAQLGSFFAIEYVYVM